jgi:protein DJ-1
VTVAGVLGPEVVTTASEVKVLPDMGLDEAIKKGPYDLIILPGGQFGAPVLAAVRFACR